MSPTLENGDILIVDKYRSLKDQDIIVCSTERLYLNDKYIVKRYIENESTYGIFIQGDNLKESLDSRDFGELPKTSLKGIVVFKFSFKYGIKKL